MRFARTHRGQRAALNSVAGIAGGLGIALALSACSHSPAAPSGPQLDIVFLSSNPGPGSTIPVQESNGGLTRALTLSFSIPVQTSDLSLDVVLSDAEGRICARGSGLVLPSPGSPAAHVDVNTLLVGDASCPYPSQAATVETTTLRASLGGFTKTFPLRYVFAGPPLARTPTRPEITEVAFGAARSGYPDVPGPNQDVIFRCLARDPDGDALTITLSLQNLSGSFCWSDRHCWSVTKAFGPRILDQTVRHTVGAKTPEEPILGRLTCTVEDARGNRTSRSVCLAVAGYPYGYFGSPPCP